MQDLWRTSRGAIRVTIAAERELADARPGTGDAVALGAADWLSLAATPTLAIMAFLTGGSEGSQDALCGTSHGAAPLSGMAVMYLVMSAFHAGCWLRLITGCRYGSH
jgi:hypothetical protein